MSQSFGFSESEICSFLQKKNYYGTDYYDVIQREQTKQWAQQVYVNKKSFVNVGSVKEGVAHAKLGKHGLAIDCYKRALKTDPTNADAFVARGASYFKMEYVTVIEKNSLSEACLLKLNRILIQPSSVTPITLMHINI